ADARWPARGCANPSHDVLTTSLRSRMSSLVCTPTRSPHRVGRLAAPCGHGRHARRGRREVAVTLILAASLTIAGVVRAEPGPVMDPPPAAGGSARAV